MTSDNGSVVRMDDEDDDDDDGSDVESVDDDL